MIILITWVVLQPFNEPKLPIDVVVINIREDKSFELKPVITMPKAVIFVSLIKAALPYNLSLMHKIKYIIKNYLYNIFIPV